MKPIEAHEFPPAVELVYRRARRLQWITLAYIASAVALLYWTMGTSQAMRANFYEDLLGMVPAAAFLIATAIARQKPGPDYPYGMHRATSIGHLVASLALAAVGLMLLIGAASRFAAGEKPTIGGFVLFGWVVWGGWPMLAALLYSGVPTLLLGRAKLALAPKLHDKILHADASMMKADWMAVSAAAVGVVGAGLGYWWLDPLAAALVSLDILRDGAVNLRAAVGDLINRHPLLTDGSGPEKLPERVRANLCGLDWVAGAEVRLREEGHLFLGEAFVVPRAGTADLVAKLAAAADGLEALDWRLGEVAIMPVDRLQGVA